eukprot:TRINITY_DN16475_c0_g1_i5.p1 TRINITY_DN16475_c0_g1~~TRINITY_DN16475_c0_g1_i5.p1  ORF type:complete len:214 (+),score=44.05 TRINITY_DN16475_c0_g1_i5:177-818(+)
MCIRDRYMGLGEIYVDDTKVKIKCDKAASGEVEIKNINRMRIPYTCLFSILESDYQFLNLTMVMDAQYDLKMDEKKKVFGALSKMSIHSVESVPKVQIQARALTIELANKISYIFDGQQLGLPSGLTVDFPRADQFDLIRFDSSDRNDTCLIYKEKQQSIFRAIAKKKKKKKKKKKNPPLYPLFLKTFPAASNPLQNKKRERTQIKKKHYQRL